ncbi:PVC-type heme-binding CxxCH protein [Lacipirellula sp.]|uniref:PVC-type heme-binding CxxCH protein n=1 Tax=Lacipirellula sp. TaxID=2691419 RepID=UPI003D109E74
MACSCPAWGESPSQVAAAAADDSIERDYSGDLPRIAPLEPEQAPKSFEIEPGFALELAAAEPATTDPVALDFDEHGRMFIVEMLGYSENPDDMLGCIRVLEDADHDGRFEKSSVYADGLEWPTAILCYDGGVFVGAPPEILYLKDADGDGRAEVRKVVFTGFGTHNVQGLLNSFRWGLENRIHVAVSSCGADLRRGDQPDAEPLVLRGRNFSFDPKTLNVSAESGASQHGYFIDPLGREFTCNNSNHIQQIVADDADLSRNPHLQAPSSLRSIAIEGPTADVFRISPVEPWREIRTRLRAKGIVPGIVEGGGRPAGYFTSATGVTIYTGDAWPAEYRGNAFVGDVGSNLVHRKTLESRPDDIALVARRATPGREFVASRDIWFRPVQFANGPDGNLYILDMYREVIEHPDSLPPIIKQHLDLTSGRDKGRLYRAIRADRTAEQKREQFSRALPGDAKTTDELVAMLGHPNGWHRTTAARLLYEQNDPAAVELLSGALAFDESKMSLEGGLLALNGLQDANQPISYAILRSMAAETDSTLREHGVRLAGSRLRNCAEGRSTERMILEATLSDLAEDPDLNVRYRVAFALGNSLAATKVEALVKIIKRDVENADMQIAVLSSVAQGAEALLHELIADQKFASTPAGRGFLAEVARQIGARGERKELESLAADVAAARSLNQALASDLLVAALRGAGGRAAEVRAELSLQEKAIEPLIDELVTAAVQVAANDDADAAVRVAAINQLGMGKFATVAPLLGELIAPHQPQEVQTAALAALGGFDEQAIAEPIVAAWRGMSPALRLQGAELLLARPATSSALVAAIEQQELSTRDLDPSTTQRLTTHADAQVRERAAKALAAGVSSRADVLEAYREALQLVGNAEQGRAIFRKNCAVCHRREGFGTEVGADLATVVTRTPEALLVNVLDPNREVDPKFIQYNIVTVDGLAHSGVVSAETANTVTLTGAEKATQTVPRADIDVMESTGLSLMPEGFEREIDVQGMADLIAYLRSEL